RAAMRLLGAFLRLLLAGALGAVPRFLAVLTFKEIWNRSFCRPREQLVDIITEFPNEVEYIFRPSCVSLQRCGGCCGDEGLRCVPVQTSTVTVQVSKWHWGTPLRRLKGRGKRRQDKRRKDCEL
uniref:Placental growth factor n=1 Tax=Coturnix japonica TaxID=93934 RepID=A0A8C2YGB5_COTJA